jgi:hypothetical protein
MKFLDFYYDLITEARHFSNEKQEYIVKNIGELLFNELINSPKKVRSLPEIGRFESYLKTKTNNKIGSDEDIVYQLPDDYGNWLESFPIDSFSKIINRIFLDFPNIKKRIDNFNKPIRDPNLPPSRRGRPPGSKSAPKPITFSREISRTKKDDDFSQEIPIGKSETPITRTERPERPTIYLGPEDSLRKRGRKPIDDGLTAMERMKFRKEGPEMIDKLKTKWSLLDQEIQKQIERIHKINDELDKRKKFFGIED